MTDTPPKPKRRRWRWLVAGPLLVVASVVYRAINSEEDARFVGAWGLIPRDGEAFDPRHGTFHLYANRTARFVVLTASGSPTESQLFPWSVEGDELRLGHRMDALGRFLFSSKLWLKNLSKGEQYRAGGWGDSRFVIEQMELDKLTLRDTTTKRRIWMTRLQD